MKHPSDRRRRHSKPIRTTRQTENTFLVVWDAHAATPPTLYILPRTATGSGVKFTYHQSSRQILPPLTNPFPSSIVTQHTQTRSSSSVYSCSGSSEKGGSWVVNHELTVKIGKMMELPLPVDSLRTNTVYDYMRVRVVFCWFRIPRIGCCE